MKTGPAKASSAKPFAARSFASKSFAPKPAETKAAAAKPVATKPLPDRDSDIYLRRLGERVRMLRNQRGMSRKALAKQAKVSERYLAQMESGLGNCSIVLLRRIARAIGLPLTQLVQDGAEPALDLVLLTQFLERLPTPALAQARELLMQTFSEPSEDRRRKRIALIGLRGGGKSTLGALLAERLDVPFIELNREIERRAGASLGEIFEMFGQETFRRAEREALDAILQQHPHFVLATSGSIVTEPATLELLLSSCFTVWLRAEPQDHMKRVIEQGDMRPMAHSARAMEDLISILKSREPLYAKAEAALTTTGKTPEQNLSELLRVIALPSLSKEPAKAG
jgi:XRE family aerobic/anaerobic benzoate catabolism transcriptional regulator